MKWKRGGKRQGCPQLFPERKAQASGCLELKIKATNTTEKDGVAALNKEGSELVTGFDPRVSFCTAERFSFKDNSPEISPQRRAFVLFPPFPPEAQSHKWQQQRSCGNVDVWWPEKNHKWDASIEIKQRKHKLLLKVIMKSQFVFQGKIGSRKVKMPPQKDNYHLYHNQ